MSELKRVGKQEAVKIAYYLMAVDGNVVRCEKALFKTVAEGFGVDDANVWEEAVDKTDEILDSTDNLETIYKKVEIEVDKLIKNSEVNEVLRDLNECVFSLPSISSNLLVWNLMTLAIKDLDYSDNERRLIEYIAKELEVDRGALVEMDNSIRALYSIQNEMRWLEENVENKYEYIYITNELEERIRIIEDSVKLLIEEKM